MTADSRRGPRLQKGLTVLRRVAPALAVILTTAGAIFVVSRSGPAEQSPFAARVVEADDGVGVTVSALNFERLAAVGRQTRRRFTRDASSLRQVTEATPQGPLVDRSQRPTIGPRKSAVASTFVGGSSQFPVDKLDHALRRLVDGDPARPVRVIIQPEPGQTDAVAGALGRGGRAVRAASTRGGTLVTTLAAGELGAVAARPDVSRLAVDARVRASSDSYAYTDGDVLKATLGLKTNGGVGGEPERWAGEGVGVAIIDSGLRHSADVSEPRIVAFFDLIGDRPLSETLTRPYDDYGHGTHVAGLIAGNGNKSGDVFKGAAAKADLIIIKVLNENGQGYTSDVIEALSLAVELTDPLVLAVEDAVAAGIVVVASAGNHGRDPDSGDVGYAGITSPGNAPSAITVGAVDTSNTVMRADDFVQDYSSRGPTWYDAYAKPDQVAPGHRLVAVLASHGSGDKLTPNAIKVVLQFTVLPLDGVDTLTQGSGASNAVGAVRLASTIDPSVREGGWWLSSPVSPVDTIAGTPLTWAQRIIWGNIAYTNEAAWALQTVWGDRLIWGNRIVWGTDLDESVVWGNRTTSYRP